MIKYLRRAWREYRLNRLIKRWKLKRHTNPETFQEWLVWTADKGPSPSLEELERLMKIEGWVDEI